MLKTRLFSFLMAAAILISGIGIAYWTMRPPAAPSKNDPDYIPYTQMLANIEAMTQQPHAAGTRQLADVRGYLLSQLKEMGVDYEILSRTWPGPVHIDASGNTEKYAFLDENGNLTLDNILVKLDAPGTDRGVLFTAHYDSESDSAGASDDMTGVCAWLEAIRRQSGNKNLKNDLYFLLTDGEELGGLGAESFVRVHREYAGIIDLVVNLDARGDNGGLLMFETNRFGYEQAKYLKAADSHPISYSWLPAMYRQMPNGTDLTMFLNMGYHGLNLAVIEGVENIVTSKDDIDHLNRGTAYNFLRTAFDISDYAANNSLGWSGVKQDGVYFTLLPGVLVLMSDIVSRILAGIAIAAALAWLIYQLRRRRIKLRRALIATGWQLGIIAAAALLAQGAVMLLYATGLFHQQEENFNIPVFACVMAAIGTGTSSVFSLLTRKRTFSEILAGLLLLMIPLTLLSAVFFNSAGYLFTFPMLALLIAALLPQKAGARSAVSVITAVGGLLLYFPLCWILYLAFGFNVLPLVSALAAIPVVLLALVLHKDIESLGATDSIKA